MLTTIASPETTAEKLLVIEFSISDIRTKDTRNRFRERAHDAQNSWRRGLFYPHWAPSANFGAGEPRFVFYPPLTWMLGAVSGLVLPWTLVPVALTFLLLAATGLATRALAQQALDDGAATLSASPESSRIRPEDLRVRDNGLHAGYLILRRRGYPAWRVRVNGKAIGALPRREDGLMAVPVPAGRVNVSVEWMNTSDVFAGRWLSAIALLMLAVLFWLERKLNRTHLS